MKNLEEKAIKISSWIGSIQSLLLHTFIFVVSFGLVLFGVAFERVLLTLTTILSLEAIYLSIFIQMSVNRNQKSLEITQQDVEEIQKDVEGISEDIEEIQEDVEEISEDIEEIQEDVDEIQKDVDEIQEDVEEISEDVEEMQEELEIDNSEESKIEKTEKK